MREIKFRAKSLEYGKWVYGFSMYWVHSQRCRYNEGENVPTYYVVPELIMLAGSDPNKPMRNFDKAVIIDPSTVGQYTGLNDKNGVEIYEGDILRSDRYPFSCLEDGEKDNYYAVVQWCDEDACFAAFYEVSAHAKVRGISAGMNLMDFSEVCAMEVVGNIHDNPELLKGGGK